jgi:hypothetical protein
MNRTDALFVYENKDTGEIRVRWLDDAKILHHDPSWNHIGTLSPNAYIQHLLNEYPELIRKMKGESV